MRKFILLAFLLSSIYSNRLPNDVQWVVASDEYKNLCYQIYNNASSKLVEILNKSKKNNYAVVMDLDETVLDNSQYQIDLNNNGETFNMESWAEWVKREEAKVVPGALEYINLLRKFDVQIIFISNRMHERLRETKNNMINLNIYSKDDIYLLRKDKKDKKDIRRNEIYTSSGRMDGLGEFHVLQYIGDAMGDFPEKDSKKFGETQFVLPNPMYGKW